MRKTRLANPRLVDEVLNSVRFYLFINLWTGLCVLAVADTFVRWVHG